MSFQGAPYIGQGQLDLRQGAPIFPKESANTRRSTAYSLCRSPGLRTRRSEALTVAPLLGQHSEVVREGIEGAFGAFPCQSRRDEEVDGQLDDGDAEA